MTNKRWNEERKERKGTQETQTNILPLANTVSLRGGGGGVYLLESRPRPRLYSIFYLLPLTPHSPSLFLAFDFPPLFASAKSGLIPHRPKPISKLAPTCAVLFYRRARASVNTNFQQSPALPFTPSLQCRGVPPGYP